MPPDNPAQTSGGMLRDGGSRDIGHPRRSRSRSRPANARLERLGRPRDDGAGRLSPPLYSRAQPSKPTHKLARGDSQSLQSVMTGFDTLRPQREWDAADIRRGRAQCVKDLSSLHSAEEDCRGRPLRGYEEWQGRAGADRGPDGLRHKDLREPFSGRDIIRSGDPREDLWRPGCKGGFVHAGIARKGDKEVGLEELNLRLANCTRWEEVMSICESLGDLFNPAIISTAFHRLSKFVSFGAKEKDGLAKTQRLKRQEQVCETLMKRSINTIHEFKPKEISVLMWALATMDVEPVVALFEAMSMRTLAMAKVLPLADFTNIMWAFGKFGINPVLRPGWDVISAMLRRALVIMPKLERHDISTLMSTLMTLRCRLTNFSWRKHLVLGISKQASAQAADFNPLWSSSLIWAFGNLDLKIPQDLTNAMAKQAIASMSGFLPKELSRLLWGFARVSVHPGPELVQTISGRALATAGDFRADELANFLWALSKLGESLSPELSEALMKRALDIAGKFEAYDVATFVHAVSAMAIRPKPELMKALLARALMIASSFTNENQTYLLTGLEKLGIECDLALTEAMSKVCDTSCKGLNILIARTSNLEDLLAICGQYCNIFEHTNISAMLSSFARVRCSVLGSARSLPRNEVLDSNCRMLMKKAVTISNTFVQPRFISTPLLSLATLGVEPSPEFASAMQCQALLTIKLFKAQEAASFLWSLAMFGIEPSAELVRTLSKTVATTVQALKPQLVSNLIWAFATLKMKPSQDLQEAILNHALATFDMFGAEDAAKFIWSLTVLEIKSSDQLSEALSKVKGSHVMESTPWKIEKNQSAVDTANETSGETTANETSVSADMQISAKVPDYLELDKKLVQSADLKDVFVACEQHGEIFNHINISTAMNRIAKYLGSSSEYRSKGHMGLTFRQEKVCMMLFQRAVSIADQFDPRRISSLVWALAALNMPSQKLESDFSAIMKRAGSTIEDFEPIDLADFIWGLATLGLPPGATLANAISNHAVKLMHGFNPQHISKFIWGFAKLRLELGAEVAKVVASRAVETISEFRPTNMSQTMWAFAKLEISPGVELAQAMLKRVKSTLAVFLRQTQCSANFLWALDKLGIDLDPQTADALSGKQRSISSFQPVSRTRRRSRSRSVERSSRPAHASSHGGPYSSRPQEKSCHGTNQTPPSAPVQNDSLGKFDYRSPFNRKRGSESGIRQTDDTDQRLMKKPTGPNLAEISRCSQDGALRKEAWLNDAGPPIRGINRDFSTKKDDTLELRDLNSRISACKFPDDIFNICESYGHMFNDINISTAIYRIAKLAERKSKEPTPFQSRRQESLCRAMVAQSVLQMRKFQPQSISNLVWSLATLGIDPGIEFINAVSQHAIATALQFTPQNIVNLMWAFIKLGIHTPRELMDVLSKVTVSSAADFKPQHIGSFMWALAKLGMEPSSDLASAISRRTVECAEDFDPQDISNLMWALAMLGFEPGESVSSSIARRTLATIYSFHQQHLSDLVWAFAKLGFEPSPELSGAILARAGAISHTFTSQSIATFLYGLSVLKIPPGQPLARAVLSRTAAIAGAFNAHGVATLVWALASLHIDPGDEVAAVIMRQALATSQHFKSHEVARFMWSLAILKILPGSELVGSMLRQTRATLEDFQSLDVSNLLWALVSLEIDPGADIVRALSARATKLEGKFKPEEMSKLIWALDRLGMHKKLEPGDRTLPGATGQASKAPINHDARLQGMSDMMWSLLKLGMETGAQLAERKIQPGSELAEEILRRRIELTPQDLSKMRSAGPRGLHPAAELLQHACENRLANNCYSTPSHPQGLYLCPAKAGLCRDFVAANLNCWRDCAC